MPATTPNLIDQLLAEQQSLTAVEKFSQKHDRAEQQPDAPAQAKYYRDLIPLSKPGKGEQYAFEVDLDACTGCKSCVVACHSQNGLSDDESWRDVGLITGGSTIEPIQQTVTSACHHCADPACMNGCPTLAYEKDEETGIVRHLDDQCIGCQYCVLKCPYDVPKYNKDLGIVRKCDMCYDRLKVGEAPACVQSCPSGAISIKVVKQDISDAKPQMIAGAFNSKYTQPTTTFRTKKILPKNLVAADEKELTPQHGHPPLVWMLTLTQVGAGLFAAEALLQIFAPPVHTERGISSSVHLCIALSGLIFALIGIGSSMLHLGSPMGAWRAFLGLRRSWLSREIVVFGVWPPLAMLVVALLWFDLSNWVIPAVIACSLISLLGAFCSVMVYADTHRDFWSIDRTLARFGGTILLGGSAASIAIATLLNSNPPSLLWIMFSIGLITKVIVEALSILPARSDQWSPAKKSALLQLTSLKKLLIIRWTMLLLGLITIGLAPVFGALFLITGEWFARSLFFRALTAPKMPGHLSKPPSH